MKVEKDPPRSKLNPIVELAESKYYGGDEVEEEYQPYESNKRLAGKSRKNKILSKTKKNKPKNEK